MRTLDRSAVRRLVERAHREVDAGLLPSCQLALALDGELVLDEAIGDAGVDTRYVVFSATKPFVAAALWALIGDGAVDPALPVREYVPGFGTNGKDAVTVEQVMLHTAGFPAAPLAPLDGATGVGRRAAFGRWRLNWEPGTRY
jgi:CubicO group peptidase (beta-lactamase class C family)